MLRINEVFSLRYVAHGHVFVFRWTEETRQELLRELGRQAANLANPLTWYDAAVLSKAVRQMDVWEAVS